jgi:hypothetical protein
MKLRALATFRHDKGTFRRDAIGEFTDAEAKELIARGIAVTAGHVGNPGSIEISANWRDFSKSKKIALAKKISGKSKMTAEEAEVVIDDDIASRNSSA